MLLLVLAVTFVVTGAFNVTRLIIPQVVLPSQDEIEFECQYEGNFTLLNWFKGPNEFFRYRPSGAPTKDTFPVIGVGTVNVVTCGLNVCRLRMSDLTQHATGLYRCEIEREVMPYKFATKSSYMRVYGHEHREPLLEGLATEFTEGDLIQAYCRADLDSEVRWYINGIEYRDMRGSRTLKRIISKLMFVGEPPSLTVQCAEMVNGMLLGSKEEKAKWKSPECERIKTAEQRKNLANNVFVSNFVLFINIIIQVINTIV